MSVERVRVALDCWREIDSFKERVLRGTYVRCFLLVGDRSMKELKTSHYAINLPWRPGSVGNDVLSSIFWGILNYIHAGRFLRPRLKEEAKIVARTLKGLEMGEAVKMAGILGKKMGISRVREGRTIEMNTIVDFEIERDKLRLELTSGIVLEYHSPVLRDDALAEELVSILDRSGRPR